MKDSISFGRADVSKAVGICEEKLLEIKSVSSSSDDKEFLGK
jgi:hypothetical protein